MLTPPRRPTPHRVRGRTGPEPGGAGGGPGGKGGGAGQGGPPQAQTRKNREQQGGEGGVWKSAFARLKLSKNFQNQRGVSGERHPFLPFPSHFFPYCYRKSYHFIDSLKPPVNWRFEAALPSDGCCKRLSFMPSCYGIISISGKKYRIAILVKIAILCWQRRRIRTLTYGVRVRCATFTQSRCVPKNKNYYTGFERFVNSFFSSGRFLFLNQ